MENIRVSLAALFLSRSSVFVCVQRYRLLLDQGIQQISSLASLGRSLLSKVRSRISPVFSFVDLAAESRAERCRTNTRQLGALRPALFWR